MTDISAQELLADLFYAAINQGRTLGEALHQAKQGYAKTKGVDRDILLGVTIMGFSDLVLQP